MNKTHPAQKKFGKAFKKMTMPEYERSAEDRMLDEKSGQPEGSKADTAVDRRMLKQYNAKKGV